MSEKKSHDLYSIVVSDLCLLCSFVFSHPLYFSYFVFFAPYVFKVMSFLSPLFITTSLLVLALVTVSPGLTYLNGFEAVGHVETNVELQRFEFEELEVYKIVFQDSPFEVLEENPDGSLEAFEDKPVDKCMIEGGFNGIVSEFVPTSETKYLDEEALCSKTDHKLVVEEVLLKENESWERQEMEGKEVKPSSAESNKVVEQQSMRRSGSKANRNRIREAKVVADYDPALGSFGSMRKQEKEWKRTLACKLFEERHNNAEGGAEGMDMLWETYEAESSAKVQPKTGKKGTRGSYEDEDDEEDDDVGGQLCCLQALKFSAGKMNLGMGRPSLVKFSKALKGMGWLHHVNKNNKKASR